MPFFLSLLLYPNFLRYGMPSSNYYLISRNLINFIGIRPFLLPYISNIPLRSGPSRTDKSIGGNVFIFGGGFKYFGGDFGIIIEDFKIYNISEATVFIDNYLGGYLYFKAENLEYIGGYLII